MNGAVDNGDVADEPELPDYPGHTAAFGRIMRTSHEGQQRVSSLRSYVNDLRKLRDDELVLLGQVRAYAHVMVWPEALAAEIARRNIAATLESTQAIRDLHSSVDTLHLTTQAASTTTREAIGELNTSIRDLQASADRWSRRLTLLTVALCVLTVGLLALAVGQAWH